MNLTQFIQALIAAAKADALKALLPALSTFFTSIAANPSSANLVAQGLKLEADLIAAAPGIEQSLLGELATMLSAEAESFLTSTSAPKTA